MSRWALRIGTLGYLALLLLVPVGFVFYRAFEHGFGHAWHAVTTPAAVHALELTLISAAVAVPVNTVFGIILALALVRTRFPGRGLVNAVVDLPLALSPVVVGLSLYLLYGRGGWLGGLADHGIRVLFSLPGIVLATLFVSMPFVVREVVPVLREIGTEQEQAAATLGASAFRIFRRVTWPAIRWAVAYRARDRRVRRRERRCGHEAHLAALRPRRGRELRHLRRIRRVGRARADRDCDGCRPACLPSERGDRLMAGITVLDVTKRFNGFSALQDVSVVIPEGSLTALLGPSGSGKSTLLRVIAGLEEPDGGHVMIGGENVTQQPARSRGVGMVFQHYAAFKHMTVWDNVAFGLTIHKRPRAEIEERVHKLLELVQLEGLAKRYPAQLSGGQRQRMALARALAVEPSVLLLDEPFGALDARVRKELRAWLRRLHDEVHVTTIIVTHDQEEAMEVAGQIVVINHGRVEQVGTPRELYDSPANEFVMSFVGPVNKIGDTFVRPRDISLSLEPDGDGTEAMVERVVHLGFEVRAELVRDDGQHLLAQLTQEEAQALELERGTIVYAKPSRQTVFTH